MTFIFDYFEIIAYSSSLIKEFVATIFQLYNEYFSQSVSETVEEKNVYSWKNVNKNLPSGEKILIETNINPVKKKKKEVRGTRT